MSSATASSISSKTLRRFRRSNSASAAVEFALIAPFFFGLLFAIIETALVFFAGQALETATQDASRAFLTDQAQSQGTKPADFKDAICAGAQALLDCSQIDIDVQSYPPGTPFNMASPIQGGNYNANNLSYNLPPAGSQNTVVIRSFYRWPLYVTGLGYNIANVGSGSANSYFVLTSTVALRAQ
jgi:Flp pilus assembly protein TadG